MCGYCTEIFAIEIVQQQYLGLIDILFDDIVIDIGLHLQEMNDLKYSIKLFKEKGRIEKNSLIDEIILCRLLTHLFRNGFDPSYQELINIDMVRSVINEKCTLTSTVKKTLNQFFNDDLNSIIPLYNISTFTIREKWQSYLSFAGKFNNAFKQILNNYHKWWYHGENLKINDNRRKIGETTVIDGLFAKDENECRKFEIIFRALVFCTMMISQQPGPQKIVQDLIKDLPKYMPDFTGLDLWLQRIAIRHYCSNRDQLIISENVHFRLPLIWYYAFAQQLASDDRIKLANRIKEKAESYRKSHDKDIYAEDELIDFLEDVMGYCELSDERRQRIKKNSFLLCDYIPEFQIDE